jgi:hypothetical protein
VRIAEALKQGVTVIIRCDAFLLGILCLWCPEVHPVRLQYGRQRLSVFLRVLSKHAGSMRDAGGSAHSCVNVWQKPLGGLTVSA